MDDAHTVVEEDELMLPGYTDRLAIDFESQVVDLALSPLIASSTPVALQLQLVSKIKKEKRYKISGICNRNKQHFFTKTYFGVTPNNATYLFPVLLEFSLYG